MLEILCIKNARTLKSTFDLRWTKLVIVIRCFENKTNNFCQMLAQLSYAKKLSHFKTYFALSG